MKALLGSILVLSLVAGTPEAQPIAPLREGDVIRDWRPGSRARLTIASVRVDSLFLLGPESDTIRVPMASLDEVSRYVGPRTRREGAARGAFVGLLVGGAAGGVHWTIAQKTRRQTSPTPFTKKDDLALVEGVILAGAGAGVGALIGIISPGEKWEKVPLASMRLTATPNGHAALQLSFHF